MKLHALVDSRFGRLVFAGMLALSANALSSEIPGKASALELELFEVVHRTDNSAPFTLKNHVTQKEAKGFRALKPLITTYDLSGVTVDSKEIGGAPLMGVSIRFVLRLREMLDVYCSNPANSKTVLICIAGRPLATIAADELNMTVSAAGPLFVVIPVETRAELDGLKEFVLLLNKKIAMKSGK